MRKRLELLKDLTELDKRLAYYPKIKPGDRDLLNEIINYLAFLSVGDPDKLTDSAQIPKETK